MMLIIIIIIDVTWQVRNRLLLLLPTKVRREWRCAMMFSGAAGSRKWQKSDTISEETLYFLAEFISATADDGVT